MIVDYKAFEPFIDKFGLIAQKNTAGADGGDSTHRFGLIISSLKLLDQPLWVDGVTPVDEYYKKTVDRYKVAPNTYTRHPDHTKWYSNPTNFSRDQTTMLFKSMMMMYDKPRASGLFKKILSNFGFYPNVYPNYAVVGGSDYVKKVPDILTPAGVADYVRSRRNPIMYPILCVLDLFKFVDIYLANRDDNEAKTRGKRTDYFVMLAMDVAVSRSVQDTFVMRAVAKALSKTDYKSSVEWIFSPRWDDPPSASLLIPAFERWIDN